MSYDTSFFIMSSSDSSESSSSIVISGTVSGIRNVGTEKIQAGDRVWVNQELKIGGKMPTVYLYQPTTKEGWTKELTLVRDGFKVERPNHLHPMTHLNQFMKEFDLLRSGGNTEKP
jgi:ribosome-associated protein YbcJ (S4-like RNA binding protein)